MIKKSKKVREAQLHRARVLCNAVLEWQTLAQQGRYPTSLTDILVNALDREYQLGFKRGTR